MKTLVFGCNGQLGQSLIETAPGDVVIASFIGVNFVHFRTEEFPDDGMVVLDALTYAGSLASLKPVSGGPNDPPFSESTS